MLKPAKNGGLSLEPPVSSTRNVVQNKASQTPFIPVSSSRFSDKSSSITEWKAYCEGGVQADDTRAFEKRREQEKRFQEHIRSVTPLPGALSVSDKLVQISPEKDLKSKDPNVLIDLDEESSGQHMQQHYRVETLLRQRGISLNKEGKREDKHELA